MKKDGGSLHNTLQTKLQKMKEFIILTTIEMVCLIMSCTCMLIHVYMYIHCVYMYTCVLVLFS